MQINFTVMESMQNQFISLSDAVAVIQNKKSYSSLARLFNKLRADKTNEKYTQIVKGKNYISYNYLIKKYGYLIDDTENLI